MYDERQPKRRKRTLMNNEQIDELEKALVDEPEMHKNPVLLQNWSEKLSLQVFFTFHLEILILGLIAVCILIYEKHGRAFVGPRDHSITT